jgi:MFS family permease
VLIIANYAVILFTQLGLSGYMPLLLLGVWVSASFPGNVFTALCVDRFGRRRFLLIGISGILVALICECALEAVYVGTTNKAGQRAAIFFIYFFILFWSSFIDATQYLYLSEIFPTHIRAQGVAVGMFNLFAASIVILVAGPIALTTIGYKFYFVLIIPTALYLVAIYFLFPETMQRSLEDINQQFGEKVALHYYGATAEEEQEYQKAIAGEVERIDVVTEKRV